MINRIPYRHDTPYSRQECFDRLRNALDHQGSIRMSANWLHAPHVVAGKIEPDRIRIHHIGQLESSHVVYLFATISSHDTGSSIVGEFRRGIFQTCWINLARFLITFFLLGIPAFVTLGGMMRTEGLRN